MKSPGFEPYSSKSLRRHRLLRFWANRRRLPNEPDEVPFQDNEEQKWDSPQLVDFDRDGRLDVVSADENGDWGDTFKNGINEVAKGSDPHDYGVGTVIFWNPR